MARRSNKSIAEIVTSTDYFSFTDQNDNNDDNPLISLERKVSQQQNTDSDISYVTFGIYCKNI